LTSAARPDSFLFTTGAGGSATVSSISVRVLEVLGKFRFSQSSAVLGIGASFSLLTRRILRAGDLRAGASSSMGSSCRGRFLGLVRRAASSVVLIRGPFLAFVRGWGGRAAGSEGGNGAGVGSSDGGAGAVFFFARRFVFLGKPPVENAGLVGEVELVRDAGAEASVWTGEMSREG
jgi:hypothetical protein